MCPPPSKERKPNVENIEKGMELAEKEFGVTETKYWGKILRKKGGNPNF